MVDIIYMTYCEQEIDIYIQVTNIVNYVPWLYNITIT